jgi:two-component system response regulator HydG
LAVIQYHCFFLAAKFIAHPTGSPLHMAKIIVKQGPGVGQSIPLVQHQVTLGRTDECDVMIADANVSRRHAMIIQLGSSTAIMDLGSSNGTFVNGTPISRCFLSDGDEVRLGDTVLVFSEAMAQEESPSVGAEPLATESAMAGAVGSSSDHTTMMASLPDDQNIESLKDIYLKLKSIYSTSAAIAQARDRKGIFECVSRAAVLTARAGRVLMMEPDPSAKWRRTLAHNSSRVTEKQAQADPPHSLLQQAATQRRFSIGDSGESVAFPIAPNTGEGAVLYLDFPTGTQGFTKEELDWLRAVAALALTRVEQIEQFKDLRSENTHLRRTLDEDLSVVARDTRMREILSVTQRVAATNSTVLVTGESGTGKELIARSIHRFSTRGNKPIVAVNCAALPESLLESELFGHEKGAFTGAVERRAGKFEQADGGTLFLDEIGDISQTAQAKILRALQEGEITRVGGSRTIRVDVRLIAATNKELLEEVKAGRFREDLYFRLKVIEITVPPLRERPEDVEALAEHFLRILLQRIPSPVRSLAPETIQCLRAYHFPGNVRELRNIIERGIVFANGEQLLRENLPPEVQRAGVLHSSTPGGLISAAAEGTGNPFVDAQGIPLSLSQVERLHIEMVLRHTKGNKVKAAQLLGISRTTLYEKLRQDPSTATDPEEAETGTESEGIIPSP